MNGFFYHELHTPNPEQAIGFYGELLGFAWERIPAPAPYWSQQGLAGGLMKDEKPFWLPYITVDDVKTSAERAQQLGGKVLQPVSEVKGHGIFAVISDPQGAVLALWKDTSA